MLKLNIDKEFIMSQKDIDTIMEYVKERGTENIIKTITINLDGKYESLMQYIIEKINSQ